MSSTTTGRSYRRQRDEEDLCPDKRPQQRLRVSEPEVEEIPVQPHRDSGYYREDGDCILRVDNTLFKIHRHLLNYPSSAFYGLFSLPNTAGTEAEGHDDSHPIRLSGDVPEHVRSFFHHAYSTPLEVQYSALASNELCGLIGTLHFAHKYRLESFEGWASGAIAHICSRREVLKVCGQELYVALLEVDRLSPIPAVKRIIRRRWVSRLTANESGLTLLRALDVAMELNFRALRGDLYYLQLQRLDVACVIPGVHAVPPLPLELSDAHKLRLLTGYRSLLLTWNCLTATPVPLEGVCVLGAFCHQYCRARWKILWEAAVDELSPVTPGDFLKTLDTFEKSVILRSQGQQAGGCVVIIRAAKSQLPHLIDTLRASMADHFLGPEEAGPTQ